ncbi:MAG: sulfurtransferase [Thermomicrobiales bacterium]
MTPRPALDYSLARGGLRRVMFRPGEQLNTARNWARRGVVALAALLMALPVLTACGSGKAPAPTITVKPAPAAQYPHPELLADTSWLAANLDNPDVRIVDLSSLADYERGHIPNAVHVWWQDLVETNNNTYGMLIDPVSRRRVLEQAGIGLGMTVVAYDDAGGRYAARLLWTLMYTDYASGKLLNGGIGAWRTEGRPVTRAAPHFAPSQLPANHATNENVLYNGADLLAHLDDSSLKVVDNRAPDEVLDTWNNQLLIGRIPGARYVPWERNLGQKGTAIVRDPTELAHIYDSESLGRDDQIIVYGLTGVDAAYTFWIMRVLGYTNVKLYDGSWAQWGANLPANPFRTHIEPPAVGTIPGTLPGMAKTTR